MRLETLRGGFEGMWVGNDLFYFQGIKIGEYFKQGNDARMLHLIHFQGEKIII